MSGPPVAHIAYLLLLELLLSSPPICHSEQLGRIINILLLSAAIIPIL